MATNIRLKRSAVSGKKPLTTDLQLGELGLNTYDGKLFVKIDRSGVESIVGIGAEEPGNSYFVTKNGSDFNDGKSIGNSFGSLAKALTIATSGDTIRISPGVYTEVFPLEVPTGVCVIGDGLRSTFIQPTAGTKDKDAFLLNGETEVTDLTIGNFFYNSSNDTGYGFRFKSGMKTTTRSPYVQRVTVYNKGSITSSTDPFGFDTPNNPPVSYKSGRGAKIDGSVVDATTLEPAMFFNECTFICPNSTGLVMTNGARTEWVNCFTYFCDKSIDAYDGTTGFSGAGKTRVKLSGITETTAPSLNDILYYLETNSRTGTYSRTGTTVTVTFNAHGLSNGDKVYVDFTSGSATDGYYTISNVATNTFQITDSASGTTSGNVSFKKALAYGTISSYTSGTVKLTNKGTGLFETASSRPGKSVTAFGDAKISTSQYKFGTSSLALDGTGDYIFVPSDSDFAYGTGDFTIEFWYRKTASGVFQVLYDQRTAATDTAVMIAVNSTEKVYVYINGATRCLGTSTLATNTWYHIAVTRTSGSTRLFINGSQEGATYSDTNDYPSKQIRIGIDYAGNSPVNGFIDEVRVSNISRYSGTFTPSSTEFVSDSNTKLLLKFEGDNNSVIIKDSTLQVQDVRITSSAGTEKLTSTNIILADYQEFGASMRSIGSAAVFGNQGIIGDGPGVNLRLFAFNFGHIGTGKDFTQDESLVVQGNEVIETNNANIQYVSIDQNGDFRVGDAFYVNEKKGIVSFGGQAFNISSLSNLDVTDGTNITSITPTTLTVGTVRLSSNTISTTSGNLIIDPAGTGSTTINGDVSINGTLTATTASLSGIIQGDTQVTIVDTGSNGTISLIADGATVQTVTSGGSTVTGFLNVKEANINTTTTTVTSSTSQFVADTFSATTYRTTKYLIQVRQTGSSNFYSSEVLVLHDGTNVYLTQYGTLQTEISPVSSIDADINSGNVRLLITPAVSDTTTKISRISLTA
jgi:hypothetical protein